MKLTFNIYILFVLIKLSCQYSIKRQLNNQPNLDHQDSKSNNSSYQLYNDNQSPEDVIDYEYNTNEIEIVKDSNITSNVQGKLNNLFKNKSPKGSYLKDIQKSVTIVCNLDNFHFHIMIDFDKIDDELISKLQLKEKDFIKSECKTNKNSFMIVLNNGWSLSLNFTLVDGANQAVNNKQFKLNQVIYNADKNITIIEDESLVDIIRGHQSAIECSNSREINSVSSVILNFENYKIETFATCVKKIYPLMRSDSEGVSKFFLIVVASCIMVVVLFSLIGFYLNKKLSNGYRIQNYDKFDY